MKLTRKALQALQAIKEMPNKDGDSGICYYLWAKFKMSNDVLIPAFESWEHFSGDCEYPVPSPEPNVSAKYYHLENNDFWNPDTEYGASRLALLDHCIEYFEELSK